MGLYPPRRWPHYGSFAQCQRPHQCNGGGHQLYAGLLCGGLPGVLPQRRRRGRGRHPAAGHEQRGCRDRDRRGSRQRVLRCRADRHPQSGGRERRGCFAESLRHVHRWHCPHCERGQKPELSAGVAGRDQGHPGGRERGAHRGPPRQRHHQYQCHCAGRCRPGRRCRDSGYDFGGCGWDGSSQPPIGGNTE